MRDSSTLHDAFVSLVEPSSIVGPPLASGLRGWPALPMPGRLAEPAYIVGPPLAAGLGRDTLAHLHHDVMIAGRGMWNGSAYLAGLHGSRAVGGARVERVGAGKRGRPLP